MPLRDHFHPPLNLKRSWDELHGQWPAMIVMQLMSKLPAQYVASPQVHLGGAVEIDVGTFHYESSDEPSWLTSGEGGTATLHFTAKKPQFDADVELAEPDEYSVRVYDISRDRRLVACIELVSPANKDRPESRQAFVAKCAALLRQEVSLMIVDVVTSRSFNLFADLLHSMGRVDLEESVADGSIYVANCRTQPKGPPRYRLHAWHESLEVGKPLPTLPLWLGATSGVMLDLEASYEETCRVLRM